MADCKFCFAVHGRAAGTTSNYKCLTHMSIVTVFPIPTSSVNHAASFRSSGVVGFEGDLHPWMRLGASGRLPWLGCPCAIKRAGVVLRMGLLLFPPLGRGFLLFTYAELARAISCRLPCTLSIAQRAKDVNPNYDCVQSTAQVSHLRPRPLIKHIPDVMAK